MNEVQKTRPWAIENLSIGEKSSRLSSLIFLILCVIPVFSTILFGAVDSATWIVIIVFCLAIVLLWLGEAWKAGGILFSTSWLQIPLLGLILIGLIQILPFGQLSLNAYSTRFFFIRLIVYFVFFAACLAFINSESRLKKIVWMVIVFGALLAFFGILQRLANPDGIYGIRETPQAIPFGPFVNQHHFAAFMQMTAGVTLGMLFGKGVGREKRVLLAAALVVMAVATVLTSSRGGLLGFLAVAAFASLLHLLSRRSSDTKTAKLPTASVQKFAIAAAAIAIVIVTLGVVLFLGGNDSLLRGIGVANPNADFSSGRLHFWPIALRIFLENPIIGAGFDAFGVAFTRHDTWTGFLRVEQAHNEYLQILAESGVAGFACLAGFIYLLFRKGLAMIAGSADFRLNAATGALAGCLGIIVHSFFDFPLRTPSNGFFFLLLAAVATVPLGSVRKAASVKRRRRSAGTQAPLPAATTSP